MRALLSLWCAAMGIASAQTGLDQILLRIAAKTPAGFSIRLTKLTEGSVVEGQLMVLRLAYERPAPPAEQMQSGQVNPRYQFGGFLVDPPLKNCGRLERPCFEITPDMVRQGDFVDLEMNRTPDILCLNAYSGHLPPGQYRAAALARRLVLDAKLGPGAFVYPEPKEYLVSQPVKFTVTPAPPEWTRNAIAAARAELLEKEHIDQRLVETEVRRRAARQIAAIDSPEARLAGLELYGLTKNRILLTGVVRDISPTDGCTLMRSRLRAPEQVVDRHYIWQTAMLCSQAEAPFPSELQGVPDSDSRRQQWTRRSIAAYEKHTREGMKAIAGRALAGDPHAGEVRATLAGYGSELLVSGSDPLPGFLIEPAKRWLQDLRREELWRLQGSLTGNWPLIHGLGGDGILDYVLARDRNAAEWLEVRRAALQLLARSDPKRARAVLLDELRNFSPALDVETSRLLPVDAVPPMDQELLARGNDLLIARYASAAVEDRVRKLSDSRSNTCPVELAAYFLRVDPPYAAKMLARVTGDMHTPPSQCLMNYLSLTPPICMSPLLEKFLVAHLQHEHVPVKLAAVRQLGAFGSAAAEKPLWDSFLYFHEWWKNRVSELKRPGYQEGRILEQHLRGAIAHGQGWLTDESKLQRLGGLCLTTQCRADNNADLAAWRSKPLPLDIGTGPYGIQGTVAQNQVFFGVDAVKQKLAQFPKSTAFRLRVHGSFARDERAWIEQDLRTFAKSKGLALEH